MKICRNFCGLLALIVVLSGCEWVDAAAPRGDGATAKFGSIGGDAGTTDPRDIIDAPQEVTKGEIRRVGVLMQFEGVVSFCLSLHETDLVTQEVVLIKDFALGQFRNLIRKEMDVYFYDHRAISTSGDHDVQYQLTLRAVERTTNGVCTGHIGDYASVVVSGLL